VAGISREASRFMRGGGPADRLPRSFAEC